MRKQIAAANWKMNLTFQQGEQLLDKIIGSGIQLKEHQVAVFAVPFPYLPMCVQKCSGTPGFIAAAQNCHHKDSGAFTGEVSVEMLDSIGVTHCIIGHSERREYHHETNALLTEKVNLCLSRKITPIFCCGEPLSVRESGAQDEFVTAQITESLFHLPEETISSIIIAYEPIWAIGTGRTATTEQAQEMHQVIRSFLAGRYGQTIADKIPILYGGSVKANNAGELFACPDVDGGLVGGASLSADDFIAIISALK